MVRRFVELVVELVAEAGQPVLVAVVADVLQHLVVGLCVELQGGGVGVVVVAEGR